MILVTGATGTVGREVVAQLVAAGKPTRALVRTPAKAHFDSKVELAVGDLSDPASLQKAMVGAEAVFSLASGPSIGAYEANIVAAAKHAGVKRIVKLSVLGAGTGAQGAIVKWHEAGEQAIAESGLTWTFVRPGGFMSNAFQWLPTIKSLGKVFAPYGDGKMPPVHPKDIAAVSVKALTSGGHEGKSYPLTGPEALSMTEHVKILSDAVGKPLAYVPVDDDAAREGMAKSGMPAVMIDALLPMAAFVRSGGAAQVLPTVEQVLGRKALTFADWAKENAAAFR